MISVGVSVLCALMTVSQGTLREYRIKVNEERVLDASGLSNLSIGNENIALAKLSRDQKTLIITGLSPGTTTLTLTYRSGRRRTARIVVFSIDARRVVRDLEKMARGIEGVSIEVLGVDQIKIDGSVYSQRDLNRISKITDFYGGAVLNLVELDPRYVEAKRLVELEFNFAEMRKSRGGSWGINWFNGQIAATGNPNFNLQWSEPPGMDGDLVSNLTVAVTGQFPFEIDYLTTRGWATTHDTHRVVVGDGAEASYQAGGQLNVQVVGNIGGQLERIPFGTLIKLTPRLGRDDVVELTLGIEVSDLDFTNAVAGVPSLRTNRVDSKVVMKVNETLALTGLIRRSEVSDRNGMIGLSEIPILGYFFGSEDWLKDRTDAVLFITPRIVQAGSPSQKQAVDRVLSRIAEYADTDY